MLPNERRLKKRQNFKAVAQGRRFHTEYFSLQILQRKDSGGEAPLSCSRFGITVTKKEGSAVERNRMRRRIRHALGGCMHKARKDCDYVVVVRRATLGASFDNLMQEFIRAFQRGKPRDKDHSRKPLAHEMHSSAEQAAAKILQNVAMANGG